MKSEILIIHPDQKSIQSLTNFFNERGDQVQYAATSAQALPFITQTNPELIFLNLHSSDDDWHQVLSPLRQQTNHPKIIFTANYPDP